MIANGSASAVLQRLRLGREGRIRPPDVDARYYSWSMAVHLLRGHTKLESTVRYLGIEVDDAAEIARGGPERSRSFEMQKPTDKREP
jgi:hypothetical protein